MILGSGTHSDSKRRTDAIITLSGSDSFSGESGHPANRRRQPSGKSPTSLMAELLSDASSAIRDGGELLRKLIE